MTDTNALRSIIADSGLKYKAIAEIMGLTPYALQMKVGWPEGRIPLAEATIYLATSPKSNSAYMAINNALELVRETGNLPVPLPKKMSATPDQTEEFNVYSYLKQLIDGNDVSVLLRVGDEAVSVLNIINFYLPSAYVKTIQNVSNGLKLALDLIRKYLPESAFTRIYLDEQPVDAGGYVAGAVALESGDINSAGVAMFKIKPQTSNVRLYWAGDLPGSLTAEELRNANRNAVLEADGQARSGEGVNISYTYKKKGFLWDKTCDGLPTKPGTYTQVAKVSGNYSCSEISRTFTIYQ